MNDETELLNRIAAQLRQLPSHVRERETAKLLEAAHEAIVRLTASSPAVPEGWKKLYVRAINVANGLTNYVEDRPGLSDAEKEIAAIEVEARALATAHQREET